LRTDVRDFYFIFSEIYNHYSFIYLRFFKFDQSPSADYAYLKEKSWTGLGVKYYMDIQKSFLQCCRLDLYRKWKKWEKKWLR
jgi:hypothetical protein